MRLPDRCIMEAYNASKFDPPSMWQLDAETHFIAKMAVDQIPSIVKAIYQY